MAKKIRVGVVFGGRSGEHEVSLVSATSVISELDKNKYEIIPIGIDKTGKWMIGDKALPLLKEGRTDENLYGLVPPDPTRHQIIMCPESNKPEIQPRSLDVIFPVLHGTYGEDGTIQGLFELADIPYVGASVLGSAICMDKIMQKHICRQLELPMVPFRWFRAEDWHGRRPTAPASLLPDQVRPADREHMIAAIVENLGIPLFVKPPNLGSSVGITKVHSEKELFQAIEEALLYDRKVIIEKAVANAREIEVSVLGNTHPRASVAGEVIPSNEFYDYDAKYVDGASQLKIPADLPDDLHQKIRDTAIKAYLAVEAEGMARVDFLLDGKTLDFYLSELNTIPGFTKISMYPKLWEASGLPYTKLLDQLIVLAFERHQQRKKLQRNYRPKQDWHKE